MRMIKYHSTYLKIKKIPLLRVFQQSGSSQHVDDLQDMKRPRSNLHILNRLATLEKFLLFLYGILPSSNPGASPSPPSPPSSPSPSSL
ncbi:hypothetical protein Lal_00030200 [Lupinus albus]|nr:hypothetical protein Lal_00030200 [Lupinus albus]